MISGFDKECLNFEDNRKEIVLKEKRSEYRGYNSNGKLFSVYRIDGCLIKTKGKSCDYLLIDNNDKSSYFIELKGCDLMEAIDQIDTSIEKLKSNLTDHRINARIIVTKVMPPDRKNSKRRRFENKIKKLNGTLEVREKLIENL